MGRRQRTQCSGMRFEPEEVDSAVDTSRTDEARVDIDRYRHELIVRRIGIIGAARPFGERGKMLRPTSSKDEWRSPSGGDTLSFEVDHFP